MLWVAFKKKKKAFPHHCSEEWQKKGAGDRGFSTTTGGLITLTGFHC